jgi:lipoate-protein ligase A
LAFVRPRSRALVDSGDQRVRSPWKDVAVLLYRGSLTVDDPALELACAHALVKRASTGAVREALWIHRASAPVVAFGRRDTHLPGFPDAARIARRAGFTPVVRATGGRAVAYTGAALILDHVAHDPTGHAGLERRFEEFGELFVDVFRGLGVDARLGAVPGEYCPGAHSVNARGTVKLVGTAQRLVRDAWLFSSLVVVDHHERLRPVVNEVYRHLGQPLDEDSVGSLCGEVGSLDTATVEDALLAGFARSSSLEDARLDAGTLASAQDLVAQHRVAPKVGTQRMP